MFQILVIVASFGVIAAIKMVMGEHQRKKQANEKWENFKKKYPKK